MSDLPIRPEAVEAAAKAMSGQEREVQAIELREEHEFADGAWL